MEDVLLVSSVVDTDVRIGNDGSLYVMRHRLVLLLAALGPFVSVSTAAAQQPDTTGQPQAVLVDTSGTSAWNDARAHSLIAKARERRQAPLADSTLRDYRARAEGFVYFYIDRRETDERTLVKIDQVALDVFWAYPDLTKQRIVGMRDESRLPNRMYYHLDHLTVVQNGFGDIIRMGDGDEVQDVLHPAAGDSDRVYDFRLADSTTLILPGTPEPVRVYEVQVRPKNTAASGFVGSVFIDRSRGDIVRMTFTFTPASYVDRRLDYINISLDSGLWDGRYWLPYEQAVELRRQVPELDFIGGAVIRGRMRITEYAFNENPPLSTFRGAPVSIVSRAALERFEFDRTLYEDLAEEGLAPPPEMETLRKEAARLLRSQRLSGLPAFRFNVPSASSVLRYNRLEGGFVGGGVSWVPAPDVRLDVTAGYAFGAEAAAGRTQLGYTPGANWSLRAAGYRNELRDAGWRPGLPGAFNTVSALFGANDYSDPYLATGGELLARRRLGGAWAVSASARIEQHNGAMPWDREPIAPADISGDDQFARALIAIDHGTLTGGTLEIARTSSRFDPAAWDAALTLEPGSFEGERYIRALLTGSLRRHSDNLAADLRISGAAGFASEGAPAQRLFLLGGRETLPGYEYRGFSGSRMAVLDAELARDVWHPWLRIRAIAAAGWTDGNMMGRLYRIPIVFEPGSGPYPIDTLPTTDGIRTSAGIGVAGFWDQLRLDLVRGLNSGGEWQLLLRIAPDFRDML